MDVKQLDELAASIRSNGVLEPIVIRPVVIPPGALRDGILYEIVCGHRRFAAAKLADLEAIPVVVRQFTDEQALEVQLIENRQRADLHPLDEAQGYEQLHARHKWDVARIAERIGASPKYVYDRMRLLALVPEAKKLFLADTITAGHAILLARLKPAEQKRALDEERGGVFQDEHLLWNPDDDGQPNSLYENALKTRSVRELQAWIDEHVKFDVAAVDVPDLFPETAATVAAAKEKAEKIVPITHDHHIKEDARDGNRVLGPRSWKRADESSKEAKACERSIIGVIVVGPGRGDAFRVCTTKTCKVHWAAEQREALRRASNQSASAKADTAVEQRAAREKAREELLARWKKATPAIVKAVAARVSKMPASATGKLADIVFDAATRHAYQRPADLVKRGKSAEDLIRHCAFIVLAGQASNAYWAAESFPRVAKGLGIDVAKILDEAAPKEKAAPKPANLKKARAHK
jgi:ParB/RepB/Spo0J family partition protein